MTQATVAAAMYKPGNVNEEKYAAFVAKTEASYRKWRAKGQAGKRAYRDYIDWTDADCRKMAEVYCGMYRHQFRTLHKISGDASMPNVM